MAAESSLPAAFSSDIQAMHTGGADFDELWTDLHDAAARHGLTGSISHPFDRVAMYYWVRWPYISARGQDTAFPCAADSEQLVIWG